ncbi:MAG: hypothetical protein GX620_12190 [Chloroflexi bacterium]|nr:hypothetical protein [Chloroflexota bacterium]
MQDKAQSDGRDDLRSVVLGHLEHHKKARTLALNLFSASWMALILWGSLYSTNRAAALWIAAALWLTDLIWAIVAVIAWRQVPEADESDPDEPHSSQEHIDTVWFRLSRAKIQVTVEVAFLLGGLGILRPMLALRWIVVVGLGIYLLAIIIWARLRWRLVEGHEIGWPKDRWWGKLMVWSNKLGALKVALGTPGLIFIAVRLQLLTVDLLLNVVGVEAIVSGALLVSMTVYDVQVVALHKEELARRVQAST